MKKLIMILFLTFIWFNLFSQTKYDSLLFEKINEYRVSNGLNELIWNEEVYNMSVHHSTYLSLQTDSIIDDKDSIIAYAGHKENQKDNFLQLKTLKDRFNKYVKNKNDIMCWGENFYFGTYDTNIRDMFYIIEKIMDGWKTSRGHNEFLLDKNIIYGACSIIEKKYIINFNNKIITSSVKMYWSTFNGICEKTTNNAEHVFNKN